MPNTPENPNSPSNSAPTPTPSAEAPATPRRVATSGDVAVHRTSGKFYAVNSNDGEAVTYKRMVDNAEYVLSEPHFAARFRPASETEMRMLTAMLPTFTAEGIVPDVRNLTLRYMATQQTNNADANPDESEVMLERRGNREIPDVGFLLHPTEADSFDNLILHPDTLESVKLGVTLLENHSEIDRIFGLSRIQPQTGKCALNFHGKPGTGKTRSVRVIARSLGKPIYQVDYSAMISKYVGDTAKHIAAAFAKAKELGAILYWDEADSLCSRRIAADEACGVSINQNRNVLMQEMDKFEGFVIFSTNFVQNFDPAIVRRIARNVEFLLPQAEQRAKIYALHFPIMDKVLVSDQFTRISKASEGFSGGDILNVAINSMQRAVLTGAPEQWNITEVAILTEVVGLHKTKLAAATRAEIEAGDLRGRVSRSEIVLASARGVASTDDVPDFNLDITLEGEGS